MKIIVDTNIIFSAILNSNNTIGDLIFNSQKTFQFYSCSYMRFEIQKHWEKLKSISKLTDHQLEISYLHILTKIKFINEEFIEQNIWLQAEEITNNIDVDDIDFVALSIFLNATLWTGDKPLYKGLKANGFKKIVNTQELHLIRLNKTGR